MKYRTYNTYLFRDKDPAIDKLRSMAQKEGVDLDDPVQRREITRVANLGETTPDNWFFGDVRKPQHATMAAYAGAFGYEWDLVKKRPSHKRAAGTFSAVKKRKRHTNGGGQ